MSSCRSVYIPNTSIVTKDNRYIRDVYVSHQSNDTLYYFNAENEKAAKKALKQSTMSLQSIYGGDILSGVFYTKQNLVKTIYPALSYDYEKFYFELDTLPVDTIRGLIAGGIYCMIGASLWITAGALSNKIVNISISDFYNEQAARSSEYKLSLNAHVNQNGVGLSLNF